MTSPITFYLSICLLIKYDTNHIFNELLLIDITCQEYPHGQAVR